MNNQEKERELLNRLKWCYRERFNKNFRGKPHCDIIVFDLQIVESKPESLDIVAEIKFSEYVKGKRKGKITADWPKISYDICRLKSLKKLELCKNAFFCYLDEYHCKKEDNVEKEIKNEIGESRIRYLYSNMRRHFR